MLYTHPSSFAELGAPSEDQGAWDQEPCVTVAWQKSEVVQYPHAGQAILLRPNSIK